MADIRVMATGLRFPEGPVAMADGSVILGEIAGSAVTRVAPDGRTSAIGSAGGGPNGLARGPDGALYVCNNGGNEYAEGGFLSTGPAKDYQCGYIQRIDPRTGETRILYSQCERAQIVGAERHRVRPPGRLLFHRSRQAAGARPRPWRALLRAARRLEDRRARPSDAEPERGRPVAGREDRLCRRHRELAAFCVRHRRARRARKEPFPAPYTGRLVCGLPGFQRFDSLAVEASGNIGVATLITGHITVIAPNGNVVRQVKMPDVYPTNICFGGRDMKTAYITLSGTGQLAAMDWPEPRPAPQFPGVTRCECDLENISGSSLCPLRAERGKSS